MTRVEMKDALQKKSLNFVEFCMLTSVKKKPVLS